MKADANLFSPNDSSNQSIESKLIAYIKSVQVQHANILPAQYVTARLLKRLNAVR